MRTHAERRVAARYRWDRLKVSFWFAPALMALAAVLLAWLAYWVDSRIPNEALQNNRLVLAGTVGELRNGLLVIAGTVLATTGVVFTLLTLPLSTVASQYGSRLLRLYLRDRTTQAVLGMFVATFVYCIAAALSIPSADVEREGPQLTATIGLYLMLATFASLIVLIQHITTMLQAPNIAAAAGAELLEVVRAEISDRVTPGEDQSRHDTAGPVDLLAETEGQPVRAMTTGYIQYVDPELLLTLAEERDLVIRLLRKPGHYVGAGAVLAQVWPADQADERLSRLLLRAFQIGNGRTPTQDIEYAVNQLTEMAVRAMSPAINDPFTAMTCLNHLGVGLALFIRRGEQDRHHYDRSGKLRLVLEPLTVDELFGAAFDMLRHASGNNATVLLHMLGIIDAIGSEAPASQARSLLLHHVILIEAESEAGNMVEQDRQAIRLQSQALQTKLGRAP